MFNLDLIAHGPRASKTTNQASGFGLFNILYRLMEKMRNFGYIWFELIGPWLDAIIVS